MISCTVELLRLYTCTLKMNHIITLQTSTFFKSLPPSVISEAYQVVLWSFVDNVALKEIPKNMMINLGRSPTSVSESVTRRYHIMLWLLAMLLSVNMYNLSCLFISDFNINRVL